MSINFMLTKKAKEIINKYFEGNKLCQNWASDLLPFDPLAEFNNYFTISRLRIPAMEGAGLAIGLPL